MDNAATALTIATAYQLQGLCVGYWPIKNPIDQAVYGVFCIPGYDQGLKQE